MYVCPLLAAVVVAVVIAQGVSVGERRPDVRNEESELSSVCTVLYVASNS